MKTVTFILSSERSGSTWVGYVLGAHQDCAFLGEFYRLWQPEIQGPCSWCAAKGLAKCEVLHGAEYVPVKRAFEFAFQRLQVTHLIDSSKQIDWASRHIGAERDVDVKVVHLVRDPRGYYESQRRRDSKPLDGMLSDWVNYNQQIRDLISRTGVPARTVFYDELAATPAHEFHPLCEFLGFEFDPQTLSYWNKVHHAFAGNGASEPVLRQATSAPVLVTGDDRFYEQHRHSTFSDDRWKTRLTADEKKQIVTNRKIQDFFALFGRTLVATGIGRAGGPPAEDGGSVGETLHERLVAAEERVAVLEQILRSRDETLNALLQSRGWRTLNRLRELRGWCRRICRTTLGSMFFRRAESRSDGCNSPMQLDSDPHHLQAVPMKIKERSDSR